MIIFFIGLLWQPFLYAKEAKLDGAKLYAANCILCHGPKGQGNGPASAAMGNLKPRNFTKDPFKFGESFEEVMKTVETGITGTPMPSWKHLPETERKAIVRYILSLRKKKAGNP